MKFSKTILRIANFESTILIFVFQKKKKVLLYFHENQSKVLGYQEWVKILMITLVSSQKSLPPNIPAPSVVDGDEF